MSGTHTDDRQLPLPPPPGWAAEYTHITDYYEAVEVLKHPALEIIEGNRPLANGTIVMLRGEVHRALRRRLTPLFRTGLLGHYEIAILGPALERRLPELVAAAQHDSVDVAPLIGIWNIMVTAALVGLDGVDEGDRARLLLSYAEAWADAVNSQWAVDAEHQRMVVERGLELRGDFIKNFYEPSSRERRSSPDSHEDVLGTLLQDAGDEWNEERLISECVMFVNAASQTTTKATIAAVANLGGWFAQNPQRVSLAFDNAFLARAAYETNRLHPSQPAILREALSSGTFDSGRPFAAGERFFVDCRKANQDPSVFGEAAGRFDPERQVLDPQVPLYGTTFGGGPHICIGRAMAVGPPRGATEVSTGATARIVGALFRAGLRLDPEREPEIDVSNGRGAFKAVWLRAG